MSEKSVVKQGNLNQDKDVKRLVNNEYIGEKSSEKCPSCDKLLMYTVVGHRISLKSIFPGLTGDRFVYKIDYCIRCGYYRMYKTETNKG